MLRSVVGRSPSASCLLPPDAGAFAVAVAGAGSTPDEGA